MVGEAGIEDDEPACRGQFFQRFERLVERDNEFRLAPQLQVYLSEPRS